MIPPEVVAHYREMYGIEVEPAPQPQPEVNLVPPDPTGGRVTEWGNAYPCLKIRDRGGGTRNWQCGGLMQPHKRCFRHEGRLWRKFTCDRCGRTATDWKVQ